MKAGFEAHAPNQLSSALTLRILGNGTLLTHAPGQLTSNLLIAVPQYLLCIYSPVKRKTNKRAVVRLLS